MTYDIALFSLGLLLSSFAACKYYDLYKKYRRDKYIESIYSRLLNYSPIHSYIYSFLIKIISSKLLGINIANSPIQSLFSLLLYNNQTNDQNNNQTNDQNNNNQTNDQNMGNQTNDQNMGNQTEENMISDTVTKLKSKNFIEQILPSAMEIDAGRKNRIFTDYTRKVILDNNDLIAGLVASMFSGQMNIMGMKELIAIFNDVSDENTTLNNTDGGNIILNNIDSENLLVNPIENRQVDSEL